MSHFFYEANPLRGSTPVSTKRMNAAKAYARHYRNALTLRAILRTSMDARDKSQASKEIVIAERKCAWWERQPHFDLREALLMVQHLGAEATEGA